MKPVMSSLLVAFASSALVAAAPAQADPASLKAAAIAPERLELARRFVSLSLSADEYIHQARGDFMASNMPDREDVETDKDLIDAQNELNKVFARFEPIMRAGLPKLFEASSQAYAREYSTDELQQMIAFAGSPAGRHFLSHRESIEADAGVQNATMDMWRATLPVMKEIRKEMCAEKAAQRVAMGDTKAKCPLSQPETQAG